MTTSTKNSIAILFLVVILCYGNNFVNGEAVYKSDAQVQLESLFIKRKSFVDYMKTVNYQIEQASFSTSAAQQLSFASDVTEKDYLTVNGVENDDYVELGNIFKEQFEEMKNYTEKLELQRKILEIAITMMDDQIIPAFQNTSIPFNRYATSEFGTVILRNNSLVYIGAYDTASHCNHGCNLAAAPSSPVKTPINIDMTPLNGKQVLDVQLTDGSTFVILANDGTVWGWGKNGAEFPALGHGSGGVTCLMKQFDFNSIFPIPFIVKIKCGGTYNGCFLISGNQQLYYVGRFQLQTAVESFSKPKRVPTMSANITHGVLDIAMAGSTLSPYYSKTWCFLSANDSRIYCVGDNSVGQMGDGTFTSKIYTFSNLIWTPILSAMKFVKISGGLNFFVALSTEGKLYTWGPNENRLGRPYDFGTGAANTPSPIKFNNIVKQFCTSPSKTTTIFIDINDDVYVIGFYDNIEQDIPYRPIHLLKTKVNEFTCGDHANFVQPYNSKNMRMTGKTDNFRMGLESTQTLTYTSFVETPNIPLA